MKLRARCCTPSAAGVCAAAALLLAGAAACSPSTTSGSDQSSETSERRGSASARGTAAARGGGSLSTDTDSRTLADTEARLAFLGRYLRMKSPVEDAAFLIHYQDNSGGMVPGPSDWDIRAVLQVGANTAAWHENWKPCEVANADAGDGDSEAIAEEMRWAEALLERREAWRARSTSPRCFYNPRSRGSRAIVFADDGLVVYRTRSQ
ncbi:hypothetical protein [Haliangium ochraceum]|uniref:Lipoprotein n=1 Tax=Haliangium ochraceum (strain DSM 14365 / JCM 11303 / SMP-2) TaxID=502025 RepID=D0LVY9_HALO1|nr:hypothetical protein [Haliangium ochraceum]ACY14123.1 hypothetical protein Hoch_1572 [Haliangium ochraceum DSM 14365]